MGSLANKAASVADTSVPAVSDQRSVAAANTSAPPASSSGFLVNASDPPLQQVCSPDEGPLASPSASPSLEKENGTSSREPAGSNSMRGPPNEAGRVGHASPRNGNAFQSHGRSVRPVQVNPLAQLSAAHLLDLASMRISLSRLPKDITTRDIFNSLTEHGLNIVRIKICESHLDVRNGNAFIDIEPPPSKWPPWNGPHNMCIIKYKDSEALGIPVHVNRTTRIDVKVKTPLNHFVPRQINFDCHGMLFGIMARPDAMFKLPQYKYRDVRLEFQFGRRFVQITFNVDLGSHRVKFYKIPIKFSHIKKMIRVKKQDGCALIIQLPSPPELLARMARVQESHDDRLSCWEDRDSWQRQVEITHQPRKARHHAAQLTKNRKTVDLAQWTTYYLDMPPSDMHVLVKSSARLGDYNVSIADADSFDLEVPGQSAWKLLNPDLDPAKSFSWYNPIHLPFEVRYQLEVCISQGLFNEYSIDEEFLNKLLTHESGTPRELDRARMMLEGVADQNVQYYRPSDIFDDPKIVHYWPTVKVPSQAAMVRRAVVTPSGIYFKTPGVELTNRVLRKYSDLTDRFLRVQFTDELSFGKLWSCQDSKKSDELYIRVLRVLQNGIVIGDRHYKILAWSNSQFREHGAFFFCANDHVSCDDIREWMGDLKHIRSVGRYAARMGQCFTTTRQLSGVSVPKIVEMKDIKRKKDGKTWNFTDGVGKISPFFAKMITHEQNMLEIPACFQFRMGGCKGVLAVWDDVPAHEVHIRPSQEKFKAPYNGLEIIKVSTFSQATLNRQIIPILSCLGVEDRVFRELLEEELQDYESALTESYKASALLRQRVDENQTSLVLADMVDTFMNEKEPFFWTIFRLWKCWALQRLKYKAAIGVKKSALLYGCVDELDVLRGHSKDTEGKGVQSKDSLPQIFLQVPEEGTNPNNSLNYVVITGLCIVGRNPSLHPGDIRVVEAVDNPGLRHLKNVVVFPQAGDRDLPSMCSGGDLDGDDFFVFWDERLLPKEWDFPPMNHDEDSSASGLDSQDDISIDDMCAFYAQYMKHDCVGLVANAHFAWADQMTPKSAKCLELANLHSMAVDYNKSGKAAVMNRNLKVKRHPHWMEREHGKSYTSKTPVGRIYDHIHVEEFNPAYDMPFDNRILSRFEHTAEELVQAKEVKARYDTAMRRLMGQHERPVSEFEIWSTFILSKPRVGTDYKLQELVGRDVTALKDRFRMVCGETITGAVKNSTLFSYARIDQGKLDRFVAAMYKVTHEEVQDALKARALPVLNDEGNSIADEQPPDFPMPLISFPWLFHRELVRIARGGVPPKPERAMASEEMDPQSIAKVAKMPGTKFVEDQKVIGKKERVECDANDSDVTVDEDFVRTASGKTVRRGEDLQLFNGQKDAADDCYAPTSKDPASMAEVKEGVAEDDGVEEVEVTDSDDEDDEDDLEELAKKLVGSGTEGEQ